MTNAGMTRRKDSEARKPRGYSRRARSEHPGVTIASERRADGTIAIVLRWTQPGTRRRCKEIVRDALGLPVASRERAKDAAIAKAKELAGEVRRVEEGKTPTDTETSWDDLKNSHVKHLEAKGRSKKTVADYGHSWPFVNSWLGRPSRPHKVKLTDLQDFLRHVRGQRNKYTGAKLAPATVESVARHVKAILNYGRRFLACVKLDAEAINDALNTGTAKRLEPVAYSTKQLKDILEKADEIDEAAPKAHNVFPLLATFMLSGCRRGELERLRWVQSAPGRAESYVDFDGDRLVIWSTKTHRHRHVPFRTRPVLRRLLQTIGENVNIAIEPFVFGGAKSLAISDRREDREPRDDLEDERATVGRSLKSTLLAVRAKCGIPFTLKGLRSTLATYLANSLLGANLYQVAYELGHDYAVLDKHYAKHRELPSAQAKAEAVECLLGIEGVLESWLSASQGRLANLLHLRRA